MDEEDGEDEGGAELWARNTCKLSGPPGTRLPFRMCSSSRRAELNDSPEEEVERSYAGLSLGPRIGDNQKDMNSDHMEEGQQLVQGLQSSGSEELSMNEITLQADSDDVSTLDDPPLEEEQQLDHGYEQSDDIDSNRMEEEQHSVGDEPSIHEITLHANSNRQSMELDESIEVEEEEEQHQLEQNDDETGGQLEDEQRLKQEQLEDEQQLEQERKLGKRRLKVIEAYERDLRALGGPVPMPKGRRRKRRRTTD